MKAPYRETSGQSNELENLLERDQKNTSITQGLIHVFLSNPWSELSKTEIAHKTETSHNAIYDDKNFLPGNKSRMDVLIGAGLVERLDAEDFSDYRKDPYAVDSFEPYSEITDYL